MGCTTAPHALRPGLLHAAEEASRDHGPEQAVAVTACIPGHSFSGITRGICIGSLLGLHGIMGGCTDSLAKAWHSAT